MLRETYRKGFEMAAATNTTMSIKVSRDGMDTLSTELRDGLGVEDGGELVLVDAKDGVLLMTKRGFIDYALDRLGEGLPDDVTLEDLIESGREIRGELFEEYYGVGKTGEGQ